eukprot:scaffold22264_cov62-Phaeocystis_antarctica.AAC.4
MEGHSRSRTSITSTEPKPAARMKAGQGPLLGSAPAPSRSAITSAERGWLASIARPSGTCIAWDCRLWCIGLHAVVHRARLRGTCPSTQATNSALPWPLVTRGSSAVTTPAAALRCLASIGVPSSTCTASMSQRAAAMCSSERPVRRTKVASVVASRQHSSRLSRATAAVPPPPGGACIAPCVVPCAASCAATSGRSMRNWLARARCARKRPAASTAATLALSSSTVKLPWPAKSLPRGDELQPAPAALPPRVVVADLALSILVPHRGHEHEHLVAPLHVRRDRVDRRLQLRDQAGDLLAIVLRAHTVVGVCRDHAGVCFCGACLSSCGIGPCGRGLRHRGEVVPQVGAPHDGLPLRACVQLLDSVQEVHHPVGLDGQLPTLQPTEHRLERLELVVGWIGVVKARPLVRYEEGSPMHRRRPLHNHALLQQVLVRSPFCHLHEG